MAIRTIVPALLLLFLVPAALPAAAQRARDELRRDPSVTIDLSVLDQLGPAPNVADVLRGAERAPHTALLPPPSAAEPKRHAAKHHRIAAATSHRKPVPPRRPVVDAAALPPDHMATPATEAAPSEPAPAPSAAGAVDAVLPPPAPSAAGVDNTAAEAPPPGALGPIKTAPAAPTPATQTAALPTTTDLPPAPEAKPAPPQPIEPQGFKTTAVPASPLPSQLPSATPGSDAKTATIQVPSPPPAPPIAPVAPAALPPPPVPGGGTTLFFAGKDTELSADAKAQLDALVPRLTADSHTRLQITGFAGAASDDSNEARRISLQRTIIVRTYLAEHGIANARMDLRAKGNKDAPTPPDRVDIVTIDH